MTNNYATIINFGSKKTLQDDPWVVCSSSGLDGNFLSGSNQYGPFSKTCQAFTSQSCALNWDGNCELASHNTSMSYPNQLGQCDSAGGVACANLTAGEILIQNTASVKYRIADENCKLMYQPFDPNVASSPMIAYDISNNYDYTTDRCVPMYEVNPQEIDSDVVMDKILLKPTIALHILVNIYNTMKRKGTLEQLKGTKLGRFYTVNIDYFEKKLYRGTYYR